MVSIVGLPDMNGSAWRGDQTTLLNLKPLIRVRTSPDVIGSMPYRGQGGANPARRARVDPHSGALLLPHERPTSRWTAHERPREPEEAHPGRAWRLGSGDRDGDPRPGDEPGEAVLRRANRFRRPAERPRLAG